MAVPEPIEVAPWYLRNINQALGLDTVTGQVYIRSSIVGGNINIDAGNITVLQGTDPWIIEGNVEANVTGNVNIDNSVEVTQGTDPWIVEGNVAITGTASVSFAPEATDAFGRLRMSEPFTLFDTNQRYYDHGQFSNLINGNANVVYEANSSTFMMNVATIVDDSVIRETKKVFPYQPGKSLLIYLTMCMNAGKTNLRQRAGFYGTQNGIYFEQDGTTLNMVIRSYSTGVLTENRVPQSSWNGDRLNGAGGVNNPSGLTLNPALDQILFCDIEWLGVGSVRVGFVINGILITCHTFNHANVIGNTTTYMTTATLPVRYEITNTGATISNSMLRQICASVISEGGYNQFGTTQTAGTGTTTKRLSTAGTYYPVVSIRLNSSRLDAIVFPRQIDVLSPTVNYYRWTLLQNATLTGATWATTSPSGTVDIDLAATGISGGIEIQTGLAASRELAQLSAVDFFQYQIGRTLSGVSDTVTLALAATANNADVLAELGWQELT
jgi:hypothetical protein